MKNVIINENCKDLELLFNSQIVMTIQLVQGISKMAGLLWSVLGLLWLVHTKSGQRKDNGEPDRVHLLHVYVKAGLPQQSYCSTNC